jgi:enolase
VRHRNVFQIYASAHVPLDQYSGGPAAMEIPVTMMNIINGAKHTDNSVDFQELMDMPIGTPTFHTAALGAGHGSSVMPCR